MCIDPAQFFRLQLTAGISLTALPDSPVGPFWQTKPFTTRADYADGLEELIAEYNQQSSEQLAAWATSHPLTPDQRFVLRYNTSDDRANIIRALPLLPTDRVLEVGCGCGPVSQYLWSRCSTLSLEASHGRARAAAHRLSRQKNPHDSALLCTDFHQLSGNGEFDWVIFVGVLEYAAIYSGASSDSPYVAMMKRARQFLKPDGRCVVAIENRLGLKYFAGATEDHYGRISVGLEGYRSLERSAPIRTFSKPALEGLLHDAGFEQLSFQFPFPDYKFTKVLLPEGAANWRFATERLIEPAPALRETRAYHLDEPTTFRSLSDDALAAWFAHSFLVVATSRSAVARPAESFINYYPLGRDPAGSIGAMFQLEQGLVRRQRLDGAELPLPDPLPVSKNPLATFAVPSLAADRLSSQQPLSPLPSLWESVRQKLGAHVDSPEEYKIALEQYLHVRHSRYLASLPHRADGDWLSFVQHLRKLFSQHELLRERATGALEFLLRQQAFAEHSMAQAQLPTWCVWAPDWIMENLFPNQKNDGVVLFDVEYTDASACLPTPVLAYRQLRVLQSKVGTAAYRERWPWLPGRRELCGMPLYLPAPLDHWTAVALWGPLAQPTLAKHEWFWGKVAEIVECAMTSTITHPLILAYETAPWLDKLSSELSLAASLTLAQSEVEISNQSTHSIVTIAPELISKEAEIERLKEGLRALHKQLQEKDTALQEKDTALQEKDTALQEKNTALQEKDTALQEKDTALQESQTLATTLSGQVEAKARSQETLLIEAGKNRAQLTEKDAALMTLSTGLRSKEVVIQDLLQTCEERLQLINRLAFSGPRPVANTTKVVTYHMQGPWKKIRHFAHLRFQAWLEKRTPHPLGKLVQYAPRIMEPERFPTGRSPDQWPRLCIITPSYNQAAFLPRTMDSVLHQNYPNIAYGVQDGGSTDESAKIISERIAELAHAESVRDEGQADAIQKGFKKLFPGKNDLMAWLNSDDTLMPGALEYVGRYFAQHPEVDVIYGHRVIIDENDQEVGRWFMPKHHENTLPWFDLVPQETLFWRSRCFQEIDGMDPSFHFAMDWDLLLRFEKAGFNIQRVPYFLGCFRVHSEQKTSTRIETLGEQEMQRLRLRTHEREVPYWEIHRQLDREIGRSAFTAWLARLSIRY